MRNLMAYDGGRHVALNPPYPFVKMSDLRFIADGWVINDANEVAPVLHQYDRIPELREAVLGRINQVD